MDVILMTIKERIEIKLNLAQEKLKEANDGAEHLSIEKELTELKKEMIEEMNKTRK